ncbi:MAG: LacI family transcriptional regulator [Lachnospiraceae bacterium]|jgi:LacI family transcriptional regulator|nr:LacI family transcriptional regulator [Lachnospiraceae bacterium]MCI9058543.1 LacI family transcriptional regulator [Lachnospiraceae bacterium]
MVTIKEVAFSLGVSPTTVSNVIHGNTKEVSPRTIARVREKLDELHYIPNMSARTLAGNFSRIIGLIIRYPVMEGKNAVQDPFNSELIGTIEAEIRKAGFFLMLYASDNAQEVLNVAHTWNVDGLIAFGMGAKECQEIKETAKMPVVFIDCYFLDDENAYNNVGLKDREYAGKITEYLIEQGHKRIAFLADNRVGVDFERWSGYCQAMEKHNLPAVEDSFFMISYGDTGIQQTYDALYARKDEFTALFFASDYYACLAINYFYDKGIRVPDEMSVVGFDDNIFARNIRPKLTTVQQNAGEKGRIAVESVIKMIEKKAAFVGNIRLDAELVIRDSVKNIT